MLHEGGQVSPPDGPIPVAASGPPCGPQYITDRARGQAEIPD